MPFWLTWLTEAFKASDLSQPFIRPDGNWDWPRIGSAVVAAGAGLAAILAGGWAVFRYFAERQKADGKKSGDPNITLTGQGAASGGNTTFHGPVSFGPSAEHIDQLLKPLTGQLAAKDSQIAALSNQVAELTKMLLVKHQAAGLDAEQRVGAAVSSIAQGAEEGDPRMQQAFAFLKENRIIEATNLLSAVAADKTAEAERAAVQAEKARKEAAVAYRNLGAIVGLADPKRALEAYEKALALDPDDIESLLVAGEIRDDYGDLAKAEMYFERVQKLAVASNQASYKAWAFTGLGRIKEQRGDLSAALKSYTDGLAIRKRLIASDPGNALWQRDLAVSYNNVGGVQEAQGDHSAALKSYTDSLAIRKRLAASDPGHAGWQRDLSVSYNKIGGVQEAQNDLSAALKSYTDSLAIRERLAASDPGNALWQHDLAVSYGMIAVVHKKQGDMAKARALLQQGRGIMVRLTELSPDHATWKKNLAKFDKEIAELAKR